MSADNAKLIAELLRDLDDALPEKLTGNESISGLYALLERCRAALAEPGKVKDVPPVVQPEGATNVKR